MGIDVATHAQVVCALEAPSGAVHHKPSPIDATAEGDALLCSWLRTWGRAEEVLIGVEATGHRAAVGTALRGPDPGRL